MNREWRALTMADVMAEFYDGPHATPPPSPDGPIYLGIKNLTEDGHLDLSEIRHISESEYDKWTKRVEPRPGDIVFTYEASLHRYAIIPEGFRGTLGRRVALLRPHPDLVDTRFLLYLLVSPIWRATVEQRLNVGSTVDRLPLTDFPEFPLCIPDLPVQRKIAAILSGYDLLIENADQRILILEEIAQRIFREWIGNFRYPNHLEVPLEESEMGPIPRGWSIESLGQLCELMQAGGTPSRTNPDYWANGTVDWYKTNELQDDFLLGSSERVTDGAIADKKTRLFEKDTILMAIYGSPTVGRMGILTKRSACNQAALAMRANARLSQTVLFYLLRDRRDHFNAIAQGAAQQNISKEKVAGTRVICPPIEIVTSLDHLLAPIWEQRSVLARTIRALRESRNVLLPKLISGALDVTDLKIAQHEEAA